MTLEEALELEDGAELDAVVCGLMEPMPADVSAAELRSRIEDFVWYSCYYYDSPGGWWKANIGTDHGPESADNDPVNWVPAYEPSEDISAAMQVVDKLHDEGDCVSLVYAVHLFGEGKKQWMANFRHADSWAVHDSLCVAICRAALKAKMKEKVT